MDTPSQPSAPWSVDAVDVIDQLRQNGHTALVDAAVVMVRNRHLEQENALLRAQIAAQLQEQAAPEPPVDPEPAPAT